MYESNVMGIQRRKQLSLCKDLEDFLTHIWVSRSKQKFTKKARKDNENPSREDKVSKKTKKRYFV